MFSNPKKPFSPLSAGISALARWRKKGRAFSSSGSFAGAKVACGPWAPGPGGGSSGAGSLSSGSGGLSGLGPLSPNVSFAPMSAEEQATRAFYVLDLETGEVDTYVRLFNAWYRRICGDLWTVVGSWSHLQGHDTKEVRRGLVASAATVLAALTTRGGVKIVRYRFDDKRVVGVVPAFCANNGGANEVYHALEHLSTCDILKLTTSEQIAGEHGVFTAEDIQELLRQKLEINSDVG